jgi:hypothetical protein
MEHRYNERIGTGLVWLLVIILLMVMIFGSKRDPVVGWLDQWETLIASLLAALLATSATKIGMRRSDQAADARHHKDVQLVLRADRQLVRRAADPTVGELLRWASETEGFVQSFEAASNPVGTPGLEIMEPLAAKVEALAKAMSRSETSEAQRLFDPSMHRTWLALNKAVTRLCEVDLMQQAVEPSDNFAGKELSDFALRQSLRHHMPQIKRAVPLAREFAGQLSRLAAEYGD